jgi:hypothetical protein
MSLPIRVVAANDVCRTTASSAGPAVSSVSRDRPIDT